MKAKTCGKYAERLAAFYLWCKGYRIVERNSLTGRGTGAGEIDLIVRKGKTLVFVEVKNRPNRETAVYAITDKQKKRIRRGAEAYLSRHSGAGYTDVRFDAVLVVFPFTIIHLKNAF